MIPLAAIGCGSAGCGGRHATIVAQIIKLGQKLTDGAAVTMFIKLIGRLLPGVQPKKQRHVNSRTETSKAFSTMASSSGFIRRSRSQPSLRSRDSNAFSSLSLAA
ncbi:hypothetical protein CN165_27945 [Sinorhizobium medicae]|nr:hypothetical protein CN165_27945 [Sinorhizobium medicae]